jgi:hypothetical protein
MTTLRLGCLAYSIAVLLLFPLACTKAPPPKIDAPEQPLVRPPAPTTQAILQKTFHLKGSATFPFEIPAHEVQPHLHGSFESFVGQARAAADDAANISFLILNEEQHTALAGDHPGEALFSVDSAHNQTVNFDLPPSMNQSIRYYLIFQSPAGTKGDLVVEASFRVDF